MNNKEVIIHSQKTLDFIKEDKDSIIVKAKFGPSKVTRIPLLLEENLAFFVATVIGDGHLKKSKYQVCIELADKSLLEKIQNICELLFNRNFDIKPVIKRPNKKRTYRLYIDSKAIYNLLNLAFLVQIGKKSNIVEVPPMIKKSDISIKSAFLIGIMVTEGGKRKRKLGLSTSSQRLWLGLLKLFQQMDIDVKKDKWVHKKYEKEYYGLSFPKEDFKGLLNKCNSLFIRQIIDGCKNLSVD
jgi:intein/homing endonuclease